MPPQPLSRLKPGLGVSLSATLIHKKAPELAAKVAHAIALSALIENLFAAILTTMLGAHARPAAAMLRSLTSLGVKKNAIIAAAEEAIQDPDMLDLFTAVVDECETATKHRHRFVHWAWAIANPEFEHVENVDSIAFVDPKALLAHEAATESFVYPNDGRMLYENLEKSEVLVYRSRDLDAAIREIDRAHDHLSALRMLLIGGAKGPPGFDRLYQRLLAAPEIASRLPKIRARRKSDPAE